MCHDMERKQMKRFQCISAYSLLMHIYAFWRFFTLLFTKAVPQKHLLIKLIKKFKLRSCQVDDKII